uniref:diacylglycerol/lipid kinase family protein n=1 Tax=Prevotella sp. TaxID=59823 RepID=UPI003FED92F3
MTTIRFIINPISGTAGKSKIPEAIDMYLDKSKFSYDIVETQYAGHATELSRQAAEEGVNVVVAVGGDGTVNEVAQSLTDTDTALAIIPCGSGNGLARHLFIPLNIKRSIEVINQCVIHDLDYCLIDGHKFFCTCGLGFDAFISFKFAESGKRGLISYVQQVLETGLKYKPQTYELTTEEDAKEYKAMLVTCANASQYGNNAYIAPQASMRDGLMDVVIIEPFNIMEIPQIVIDMFSKTLNQSSRIKTFRTKHLHIHRSSEGPIHYDGEPVMAGADVDINLVPKGIKVVVNDDADKSKRKPTPLQKAACEIFNDLNTIQDDIARQTRRGIKMAKMLQKKIGDNLPNI